MAAANGRTLRPVVLLLSLLLLSGRRAEGTECGLCHCHETYVDCDDPQMDALPTEFPDTTENVYIRYSPIRELTAEVVAAMGSLPELSDFEMTDGALETVGPEALRQFPKLYQVDFSRNRIRQVAVDAIPPSVRFVFLSDNPLQIPSEGPLLDAPGVEYVHLGRCGITELPPESLSALPKLYNMDVDGNHLTNLHPDIFANNPAINYINLDDNPLQAPEQGPLLNSESLETLDLGNTSLCHLTADMFSGLPNLESLWLRDNGIESLPDDFFSTLQKLNTLVLSSNPLRELPPALQALPGSLVLLDLANTSLGPTLPSPLTRSDSLELLDLSENDLTELSGEALAGTPNIATLDVEKNRHLKLDVQALTEALPNLMNLWASDTTCTCPCLDEKLVQWAEEKNVSLSHFECDDEESQPC